MQSHTIPLFRLYEERDLPAVLEVYRQCEDFLALGPVARASLQMVQQDLAISRQENGIFCVIQVASGELVGVVDYIPQGFMGSPEQACLSLLMISRPFRGQGLGKQAVEWVENQVQQDPNITAIYLGVQINNQPGLSFWQHRGYRIISGPTQQADQTITFLMKKDLSQSGG
jgi:GNAT superfamily N-acetyltransferase